MNDNAFQVVGLVGFIGSGVIFSASGIRHDDWLTLSGSVLWIAACLIWLVPLVRGRGQSGE